MAAAAIVNVTLWPIHSLKEKPTHISHGCVQELGVTYKIAFASRNNVLVLTMY